jgi:formylglycine-generating enzyme required for sulfatase activity
MKKTVVWMAVMAVTLAGVQAQELVVSWSSNGVLQASGLEPGTTCSVEAVFRMGETFTNAATFFDSSYVIGNDGMMQVAVPMFFRVRGTPAAAKVEIPAGINSGTNPLGDGEYYHSLYPETYALTNESAFYMDATEVTKAQWDRVYNWAVTNGYSFDSIAAGKAPDHPVQRMTWYDCVKWCNARSEREGRTPCYTVGGSVYKTGESEPDCDFEAGGYRLPTSGEWEYAARGGLVSQRFPWGDTISHANANYRANGSAFSYDTSPYVINTYHPDYDDGVEPYTSPVGVFAPNGYGLYDMSGNVSEFCNDWVPGYEGLRVLRGGSSGWTAPGVSCGHLSGLGPDGVNDNAGFRTVRPAD